MTNEERVEAIRAGRMQPVELWLHMKPFIQRTAVKYTDERTELEDLMQESYFGVLRALELFDPGGGANFRTYSAYWIRQRLARYKEEAGGLVRVPSHAAARIRKYRRFLSEFAAAIGRDPTDREILAALGEDRETLERDALALSVGSLDKEAVKGEGDPIVELLAGPDDVESSVLDKVQAEELSVKLWECVDTLPEQQRKVVRLRYKESQTLDECGEALGVSRERIRQVETAALRKMRTGKIRKELEPFVDDLRYSVGLVGGVESYRNSRESSTERAAMKAIEYAERLQKGGRIDW